MTKTATLALLRIEAIEEANRVIACQKGRIARANNRPRDGALVPKEVRETPELLVEFQRGWDSVQATLKAEVDGFVVE